MLEVIPATIVLFACGSSAVNVVLFLGRPARWAALLVLCLLAVAAALAQGSRVRPPAALLLAAAGITALAVCSAFWSVAPRLSFGRALALGFLFAAAAAIASATAGRPDAVRRVLIAILVGCAAVAIAGLLVLAASPDAAFQDASTQYPARYRGIGQNPNTTPMLLALAVPLCAWSLHRERRRSARIVVALALALFVATIAASSSRGALLGATAGTLAYAAVALGARSRVRAVVAILAVAALTTAAMQIPDPAPPPPPASPGATAAPTRPDANADRAFRLDIEIGRGGEIRRTLFSSSGRSQAWSGALELARERPVAGYGFGTEERVFVDRYYYFDSRVPENSYIGIVLQLGIAGLAAVAALLAALLISFRRAPQRELAAACCAVLVAGLVVAATQSYLFSVGNNATLPLWIAAFLLGALAQPRLARTPRTASNADSSARPTNAR